MTMHQLKYQWLFIGVLVLGFSIGPIQRAQAIPMQYDMVGFLTGTITADFNLAVAPVLSWDLTSTTFAQTYYWSNATDVSSSSYGTPGLQIVLDTVSTTPFSLSRYPYGLPLRLTLDLSSGAYTAENSIYTPFFGSGQGGTFTERVSGVPEPSTGLLLVCGLMLLAGVRWFPLRREREQLRQSTNYLS